MRRTFINEIEKTKRPVADTFNTSGGPAFTMSDQTRLNQLCMIGVMGNTYYANEKKLIADAIPFLKRMAIEKPEWLAEAIDTGRNKGYIRTMNILGLIYLSTTSPKLFKDKFQNVIKTGGDMGDFIDLCHKERGFGRAVKTAMIEWLNRQLSPFYAVKYRKQITDAIKISRPKPFEGREGIFDWLFDKPYVIKEDVDTNRYSHNAISRYDCAKKCIADDDWKGAIEHINAGGLDYASLTSYGNPPKEAWDALGKNMGTMALLKHLKTLEENGFFDNMKNVVWFQSRFTVESLKKNKVFPFRLYTAYENVTNTHVKNTLADLLDEYAIEYDWSSWTGITAICPDVSGSMGSTISLLRSKGGVIPAVVAGMFTGFLHKGIKNSIVIPWDTTVKPFNCPRGDSVITQINYIKKAGGGGTSMEVPVAKLIAEHKVVDQAIFITDAESWYGSPWINAWINYRKIAPKARAILIRVDSSNTTNLFPEDEAVKYGIYQVFGWNDNVIPFIENAVFGHSEASNELE